MSGMAAVVPVLNASLWVSHGTGQGWPVLDTQSTSGSLKARGVALARAAPPGQAQMQQAVRFVAKIHTIVTGNAESMPCNGSLMVHSGCTAQTWLVWKVVQAEHLQCCTLNLAMCNPNV